MTGWEEWGHRTPPDPGTDGFLHDERQAAKARVSESFHRLCRWCGRQMRWSGWGAFLCSGGCDRVESE